jgi:hypothetical protein
MVSPRDLCAHGESSSDSERRRRREERLISVDFIRHPTSIMLELAAVIPLNFKYKEVFTCGNYYDPIVFHLRNKGIPSKAASQREKR